tara:strand:- start:264 stop:1112 length:849 start_codon:yes stop_codon:yes gene_type:complete
MADRVFCIGNGESRKNFDLQKLKPHGKIYGCNALYRDFTPDVLCAVDMGIMHEIYNSGYAQNNKVVFRDWNKMPGHMYEQLLWAGQNYSDQDYDLIKKENVIKSNERGDKKEFVMHGSNLAGVVEILKKNKERKEKKVNHTSINVSWVSDNDKVRCINDYMQPKDRGWACGATSGYFAVLDENPREIFLIGHDLESVDGKLNNMYKDTKHYGLSEAHKTPPINWIRQWRELMREHPHITFYKVNPSADSCKDPISTPIKDWVLEYKNVKYIDFATLDKMLEK